MRILCSKCRKSVSTEVPEGTVVRAWLECPECVEGEKSEKTTQDIEHLRKAVAGEVIGDGLLQIRLLVERLAEIREALGAIVISEGVDSGAILLSDDSPAHHDAEQKCQVYDHKNFSPLGDALVAVSRLASVPG